MQRVSDFTNLLVNTGCVKKGNNAICSNIITPIFVPEVD